MQNWLLILVAVFVSPQTSLLCVNMSRHCHVILEYSGRHDISITNAHLCKELKETQPRFSVTCTGYKTTTPCLNIKWFQSFLFSGRHILILEILSRYVIIQLSNWEPLISKFRRTCFYSSVIPIPVFKLC